MNLADAVAGYLESGCTKQQRLGLEMEHFIENRDGQPVSYYGKHGVAELVRKLAKAEDRLDFENSNFLAIENPSYTITLEPGAQVEISLMPFADIADIKQLYDGFLKQIKEILSAYQYRIVAVGTRPELNSAEIPLIPKRRYTYMDEYFMHTGKRAKDMMRNSASCQVSIDYCDEQDFVKKYRAANLLSPLFALMMDTSEQKRGRYLERMQIWEAVDKQRTGVMPSIFDDGFGFYAYGEYVAGIPAIFMPDAEGGHDTGKVTMGELAKRYPLDSERIAHYISMIFPVVRAKDYIEIRPADSVEPAYVYGYCRLIQDIFYQTGIVEEILKLCPHNVQAILDARRELVKHGYEAVVYGRTAGDWMNILQEMTGFGNPGSEGEALWNWVLQKRGK